MPVAAAELAIGDHLQAGGLLLGHQIANGIVLDGLKAGSVEFTRDIGGTGVLYSLRTKKAADDVTANTKWVGDVIEELDPISSSYTLEVSSPGMARPLRRPSDFARFVGENCELTSTATEGRRKYAGKIAAATETNVTLELEDGESVTLDFSDVKRCKLKPTYDFKPAKEGK